MPEPRIRILPQEIAEHIAAGEVVERPASVVKELVENALDAGCRRVVVETVAGGKELIRVTDDGCGMTAEEVQLALQRHATSKLRSLDDLFRLTTLGFRGEALPSIAAVSELEIVSGVPEAAEGTRAVVHAGRLVALEPAPPQVGTTVAVRRLFFNVPARRKFLRSDAAELAQIAEWLQKLALSRPEVAFRLTHEGREVLLSPGSHDPFQAVVAVLGRNIARSLLRVGDAGEVGPYRVTGFVGDPTLSRASRAWQHFYVNRRAVRSPLFYRALDDAFRSMLPQGRYPIAVLFLDLPPDRVDVNVHPAKIEVRFQDEGEAHRAIAAAVQAALRRSVGAAVAEDRVREPGGGPPPGPVRDRLPFAESAIQRPEPAMPDRLRPLPPAAPRTESVHRVIGPLPEPARESAAEPDPFAEAPAPAPAPAPEPGRTVRPERLRALGQAQDLFILAEGAGRLWVIDQHVAHERVLFEQLLAAERIAEEGQPLLFPVRLALSRAQAVALEENLPVLAELGFAIEPFGRDAAILRAVPQRLVGQNYEALFQDMVDELVEQTAGGRVRLAREQVATAAAGRSCRRAVKAGRKLSPAEMQRLLDDLCATGNPHTCPHGRPVFLAFDEAEVAALFGERRCD